MVQRDLPRRRRQQVLTAEHVGDLHQGVVDRVHQRVERVAVGTAEREVGDVLRLEGDLAAHQVVPRDRAVGHPEPDHWPPALGLERRDLLVGELAAEAVVPLHLGAGRLAAGVDLLGRAVAVVGELRVGQLREHVAVEVAALGLAVRRMRAALAGPLVPVEAEPVHRAEHRVVRLLGAALLVGVLDAEDERAAVVAREGPVVEGRAGEADVR